jgi:hypothetical protein
LRKYTKSNNVDEAPDLRADYTDERKQYKQLLREKKSEHKKQILKTLSSSKDPRKFWSTLKFTMNNSLVQNSISANQWFCHFQQVFDSTSFDAEMNMTHDSVDACLNNDLDNVCDTLDQEITQLEVEEAIRALKSNKAAGPDGFSGEFYKYSAPRIVTFFTKYFNKLFESGTFPSQWCESVIQPIHKKGDVNSPDNYRGISLLNVSGKLYSYVLNKRLSAWVEDNSIVNEAQAGFRRNYSTNDHIFTLLALVQKHLLAHRKLYVAFIDFKKAFDSVNRRNLWNILQKHGVRGKMYRAIKCMYDVVKARVRVGGDLTECFMCPRGLKQGEICSPILFSLLINELVDEVISRGKHGVILSLDLIELLIMLFADDVVLLSYSVIGLQRQLNILRDTAKELDLVVNLSKSNVIVFRKGGYLALREKWYFDGSKLEVVNQYKYLGVIFSTGLTFSYALEDMAKRAKKGVIGILKLLWTLGEQSPKLFFKLFDSQIQPILTYGAEVWGLNADSHIIEKIHLFAMKRLLNVSIKTPNALVYGEFGRYPLYVNTYTKCIKYWLHILSMPESRLPLKSYKMLYSMHCNNKNNWVSSVCFALYRYGFGYVWENQGVGDVKVFVRVFRQRLVDCYLQEWNADISSRDRFAFFSSFKQTHSLSQYLLDVRHVAHKKILTRFRLGVSPLYPHRLRFSKNNRDSFDCPFCKGTYECEFHFLLVCPKYTTLRESFLPTKFYNHPTAFKMSILLANSGCAPSLAAYIFKAFELRSALLTSAHQAP